MDLIQPMEPILEDRIVTGDEWIHQIKWDGIRGITYIEAGKIHLFTKKGRERTAYYPELESLKNLFKGDQAILDGELIVLDESDKPSFEDILKRERIKTDKNLKYYTTKYPIKYVVFDLLALNGNDIRKQPLNVRKELLVNQLEQDDTIAITDDFKDGNKLMALMKDRGWEGIVSKKINSYYSPGKSHHDWIKTKIYKKILTVVGGIRWKNGVPSSLLLGVFRNQKLSYVGKVNAVFKEGDLVLLNDYLVHLQQKHSPFVDNVDNKGVIWLKPILTCWVQFMEWTSDFKLRHPKILGFSTLKPQKADGTEWVL
ncbi:ATP-dependent DNA ligase [Vulcanibacillus modesticaldus]|uniref:DNA ligase (ATP) n=1 Tax=Vulcanibacillus modesticaldus TaxID=337097 RepID=A0A1D2YTZ7_9BACI|nr:non-homologous end-joining DNA ligase [Vulcanibacillus modesticaldus]OEF99121.1 ATP-dependent DNA ligase [Vulcanibacillus modesticaldus]